MKKVSMKKIFSILAGAIAAAAFSTSASAYHSSTPWGEIRNVPHAPSSVNTTSTTVTMTSDGHRNIYISCDRFEGENNGAIVYFNSYYYENGSQKSGVNDRFTTEKSDTAYAQSNIPPYGATIYIHFVIDVNNSSTDSASASGSCHTNS